MYPVASSRVLPSLLRQLNERRVLAALQRQGPLSRAEICRLTGISGPTVTRVVTALMEIPVVSGYREFIPVVVRPGRSACR
ncbi:MAG: winged helix-turn-helix domain-containing protein [Planctomycetes bacterium]|nr:winged helix-turn-helix domain-containing protein [Planctomycetota bacterium]